MKYINTFNVLVLFLCIVLATWAGGPSPLPNIPVPVSQGGTGATTVDGALTTFGLASISTFVASTAIDAALALNESRSQASDTIRAAAIEAIIASDTTTQQVNVLNASGVSTFADKIVNRSVTYNFVSISSSVSLVPGVGMPLETALGGAGLTIQQGKITLVDHVGSGRWAEFAIQGSIICVASSAPNISVATGANTIYLQWDGDNTASLFNNYDTTRKVWVKYEGYHS